METIVRGLVIYFFLLIVFRISGKRTLHEVTTFDFVLLIIIAETTEQALLSDDHSITNSLVLIVTLVFADVTLSIFKQYSKKAGKILDGTPTILVADGNLLKNKMDKARVDKEDIMEAARKLQGLETMSQIKYAILEIDGSISIVPKGKA
ncbi:uncharacterized membrane protein YcaP (DUF421 family) [Pontibacter aydingkolensis]|uniref:DUF421 domain-containing protein n=1 Tax=Pontibacter aydingkolensis TaxID=1911536 RepID=A0ABS7CQH3_9BACT|nr:YetF domain-containing protein [Pontibacter aydingkolensis]MBW7466075.1 DUF421 domain-containing protein [Pontibacter aydingkolensis]